MTLLTYGNFITTLKTVWKVWKVYNVKSRIEILRKKSRCFLCLKSGHIFKNCISSYTCRKCDGKHHISLCSKLKKDQEKDESSAKSTDNVVAHVGYLKGTLLQTAKGKVAGINADEAWTTTPNLLWNF